MEKTKSRLYSDGHPRFNNCLLYTSVLEPASAEPVVIEDDVLIGANAVILEGVRIGQSAVIAAGAVVTEDVPPGWLAAGVPARLIKRKDEQTRKKTEIVEKLRDSSR